MRESLAPCGTTAETETMRETATARVTATVAAAGTDGTPPGAAKAWGLASAGASHARPVKSSAVPAGTTATIAVEAETGAATLTTSARSLLLLRLCCWALAPPATRRPLLRSCCRLPKLLRPLKMEGVVGAPLGSSGQVLPGASPRRRAPRQLHRLVPRRRSSGPPQHPRGMRPVQRGWPTRNGAQLSLSCARRRPCCVP